MNLDTKMFKKAKQKIVVSIMAVLIGLFAGILTLIYASSYVSVSRQNYAMLEQRAKIINGAERKGEKSENKGNGKRLHNDNLEIGKGKLFKGNRKIELETFYSVILNSNGNTYVSDNGAAGIYSENELITLAQKVKDKSKGNIGNLVFLVTLREDQTVVLFMDNTIFRDSFTRLFNFTLIFGLAAIIVFFFVSNIIAGKIVKPMEQSYLKQKQFTSDAGHELKTPVAAVNANIEILRREIGENQWLNNISFENKRMEQLVLELLELANNENTKMQMEQLDFSKMVTGAILPLEAAAYEKNIVFKTDIDEQIIIQGNKAKLEQLVTILVDNAVSHTEKGEVQIHLNRQKDKTVLSITNPGAEIPVLEREKIFERFYRIDDAHASDGHFGLGLAIAKSIVQAHNGIINVNCPPDLVCFTVKL